jgi:nicotinamidase-related amidase
MTSATKRLRANNTILLVIDMQDKLLAKVPTTHDLTRATALLLDVAALLGVPVLATEQYPKGLGPTSPEIAARIHQPITPKTVFSCCGAGTFLEELELLQRPNVVLAGIETHVCVMQTALDLIEAGLHVFIPVDAVEARFHLDHHYAIRRMELAGGIPTTAEAVVFEWIADAAHPQFKAFSKLIVERTTQSQ